MKRLPFFLGVLFLLSSLFVGIPAVRAESPVILDFFHSATCGHCQEEDAFLADLEASHPELLVRRWEITEHPELYAEVRTVLQDAPYDVFAGVPLTLIGGYAFSGFDAETDPENLESYLQYYARHPRTGIVDLVLAGQPVGPEDFQDLGRLVQIPLVGPVDPQEISLVIATAILGFFDGINPCAMWVLILLVTFLANLRDRKRMWILGSAFLFASGAAYFLILIAWMNLSALFGAIGWIRIALGVLAMAFGVWQIFRRIREMKTADAGCTVTDEGKKKRLASRLRDIVAKPNLGLALLEIALLALSVNVLELACSPVYPAVFGTLLALDNSLSALAQAGYILLYVVFFLLDDFLVFGIAMATFRVKGISARWSRIGALVAACLLFALGFFLTFFPEILFLNF